jgi:hypothetical protein
MSDVDVPQQEHDGRADFDFLVGRWNVHHRQLQEWLKGSTAWDEFEGTVVDRKVLGGLGHTRDFVLERASGTLLALATCYFDPRTQLWSLYWADSINGIQLPPAIGKFTDGRGEFYDHEVFGNQAIFSRFIWSEITENTCRFEQAFSVDGGRSWETNWIMKFTRQPA